MNFLSPETWTIEEIETKNLQSKMKRIWKFIINNRLNSKENGLNLSAITDTT